MLLLYQVGSVKIGEVVRYTVTYTPSHDRILPSPESLHLRVRNTCAIALRAAFVHGPYTLSAAAYPSTFDPNQKLANPRRHGVPEFEPMLKAGGTWNCRLLVPDGVRRSAATGRHVGGGGSGSGGAEEHGNSSGGSGESVSWIVEVSSQVVFSTSAAVHYEILLARDEKSLSLGGSSGVPVLGGQAQVPLPGRVSDYQQQQQQQRRQNPQQQHQHVGELASGPTANTAKGVFSRAIRLKVEDTASLWNKPPLPGWDDDDSGGRTGAGGSASAESEGGPSKSRRNKNKEKKLKKIHLVVLTHGLHSNLGSDMLYLKESIDSGVRRAKTDAKRRKARERAARKMGEEKKSDKEGESKEVASTGDQPTTTGSDSRTDNNTKNGESDRGMKSKQGDEKTDDVTEDDESDSDDEEVIVRGFSGNATRTERGIKYLGKRLARFVLSMTYPDQPYSPTAKAAAEAVTQTLKATSQRQDAEGKPTHNKHDAIRSAPKERKRLYKMAKISFIGHSLGGLVQTYAVAYIQKHSPQFFTLIEPVNFIAMASPFLGLNHENPLYVKFALDFGLVGRTGQDLGLTWRAPTIARNGWGAIVGNLGENAHKHVYGETQPESKPLLRILPTGPAHIALKKFRNRTVYSNVVNDGIVPLRTSCLLFLDWQGLGRVDKARREAGLVETVVRSGWAELTGANVTATRTSPWQPDEEEEEEGEEEDGKVEGESTSVGHDERKAAAGPPQQNSHEVPQPPTNATLEDDRQSLRSTTVPYPETDHDEATSGLEYTSTTNNSNPFSGFFNFFRSSGGDTSKPSTSPPPPHPHHPPQRQNKIYQRSQTLKLDGASSSSAATTTTTLTSTKASPKKPNVTNGNEFAEDLEGVSAPPTTTFFESAGDLLNPTLPSVEYLIDPTKRPRTIFHDRVYHPSDIPPPPLKRRAAPSPPALHQRSLTAPIVRTGGSGDSSPRPSTPPVSKQQQQQQHYHRHDTAGPTAPGGIQTENDEDEDDIDNSQMKVEEKIARAYHRGLSWRKVLVKLEPDAHNNMIVRRMFANAFGWPVVNHLVEAHFSDSATARTPDEETPGAEAAGAGADTRVDAHARAPHASDNTGNAIETRDLPPPSPALPSASSHGTSTSAEHEDAAADPSRPTAVATTIPVTTAATTETGTPTSGDGNAPSNSPATPGQQQQSSLIPTRPGFDRLDSVSWTERDWADSAAESEDADTESSAPEHQQQHRARARERDENKGKKGTGTESRENQHPHNHHSHHHSAGGSWSWTEKIVGRGAGSRSRSSPRSSSK